jgi:hypothetical protein
MIQRAHGWTYRDVGPPGARSSERGGTGVMTRGFSRGGDGGWEEGRGWRSRREAKGSQRLSPVLSRLLPGKSAAAGPLSASREQSSSGYDRYRTDIFCRYVDRPTHSYLGPLEAGASPSGRESSRGPSALPASGKVRGRSPSSTNPYVPGGPSF